MERLENLSARLGTPTAKQLYVSAMREGIAVSRRQVNDWVARQETAQLFRAPPASKGKTATRDEKDSLQVDLIDLKQLASGPYNYILIAINPFNRKVFMDPLKKKDQAEAVVAMRKILDKMPVLDTVSSDLGNEFKGSFNALLPEKGIIHRLKQKEDLNALAVLDAAIGTVKNSFSKGS